MKAKNDDLLLAEGTPSPAPPYSPLPVYASRSGISEANTQQGGKVAHPRIRRIGSVAEEINNIHDEESRRLTEVAYLC